MQEVYKTTVTCTIGYSIQSPDQSWEKSSVAISSEIGPGYPTKEFMTFVLKSQIEDTANACNEQIEEIAKRIVDAARKAV